MIADEIIIFFISPTLCRCVHSTVYFPYIVTMLWQYFSKGKHICVLQVFADINNFHIFINGKWFFGYDFIEGRPCKGLWQSKLAMMSIILMIMIFESHLVYWFKNVIHPHAFLF